MKRAVLALVLVLVVVAAGVGVYALAGSLGDEETGRVGDPAGTPSSTDGGDAEDEGAREAPSPGLQQFYDQKPAWKKCDDFQCATIEVPLDYADPTGETIELALLKNPADKPAQRIGSLVVNPGGPGAPGTAYAGEQADDAFTAPVRNRFDIVGFDPRGTGASAPVDCLTDAELDSYIASDPDPDNAAEVQEFTDYVDRMGQGCADKSGALAAHVSTHEAARDIDVIRAVLGEEKLAYFGASYGTKLGATYADLFPDRSGHLVLDGAVDVSLSPRDSSIQQAEGFEVALTAYVDDCIDGGDCYLGDTRQAALGRIKAFLADVEEEPLDVGSRKLAIGNAFYGIVAPLYNDEYWPILTQTLEAGIEGDGTGLLYLSDLYTSRNEDGSYDDNSSEAIYAINCLDDSESVPAAEIPAEFPAFDKASPTFGRVFAWGLMGCSGLAVTPPPHDWDLDAAGADPMLVIGTTRDPATPLRWAKALAAQLDPAVLVTRDGDGHTGYNMGNDCVDDVVEGYLIDGKVPSADVECPAR